MQGIRAPSTTQPTQHITSHYLVPGWALLGGRKKKPDLGAHCTGRYGIQCSGTSVLTRREQVQMRSPCTRSFPSGSALPGSRNPPRNLSWRWPVSPAEHTPPQPALTTLCSQGTGPLECESPLGGAGGQGRDPAAGLVALAPGAAVLT